MSLQIFIVYADCNLWNMHIYNGTVYIHTSTALERAPLTIQHVLSTTDKELRKLTAVKLRIVLNYVHTANVAAEVLTLPFEDSSTQSTSQQLGTLI